MLDQMRRAELNRRIVLQEKIKKAQEEELKVLFTIFCIDQILIKINISRKLFVSVQIFLFSVFFFGY